MNGFICSRKGYIITLSKVAIDHFNFIVIFKSYIVRARTPSRGCDVITPLSSYYIIIAKIPVQH